MFSLRSSAPTRRAAYAILQPNVLTSQLLIPPYHGQPPRPQLQHQQAQQRRQYAMRAPSLSRRPRPAPTTSVDLLFNDVPVPSIDLWREFKDKRGLGDVAPETCLHAFTQYCLVASNDVLNVEPAMILQRDFNIDLLTLHYTALPLFNGPDPRHGRVAFHMLFAASSMGYTPSIITTMGIVAQSGRQPDFVNSKAWRALDTSFKRLLRTGNNPDVFTLQGLMLLRQRQADSYVLGFFDKAIKAAGSMPPSTADQPEPGKQGTPAVRKSRWTYEKLCHLERGHLLLKHNRTEEAMASFKISALELDHPEGYVELAKLLPRDAPERETHLLMAAQAGNFEACRLLALHMADKAADPALSRDDRTRAGRLAREWAMVEPDSEKREEVDAQVTERLESATSLG